MSLLDLTILLCATLLAILEWIVPRLALVMLKRRIGIGLGLLVLVQLWAEGVYWQLVPVYALLLLVLVARVGATTRTRVMRLALASTVVATMLVLAASWIFLPVPRLPKPTGQHPVGTKVFRWVMPKRDEPATSSDDDRRNIIVQAWYPAAAKPTELRIPYLDGLGRLPQRVSGVPRAVFARYDRVDTHAIAAAAVSADVARWPVVVFSPGYGASRSFYTTLLSDLASRGVIVLAVDHPYEASITELADGRIVTPVEQFVPGDSDRIRYMIQQTHVRVADVRAVLDAVELGTPFGALAGRMDESRITAAGHSFGGAAAVATASVDERIRASVNIDGTLYGSLPDQAAIRPFLLVQSDRAETGHGARFIDGHARLFTRLGGRGNRCRLVRANPYSFTDAPLLLSGPWRWMASLVVGGSRGTAETVRVTNDLMMDFMLASWSGTQSKQCMNVR